MKAIILAAGYATRLYPLTKNKPKPLLELGSKTIIDYILENLATVNDLDKVYIVTNNKFYPHFLSWLNDSVQHHLSYPFNLKIINDLTCSNESRLGAIGDIHYTLEQEDIQDDLFVLAGDNIYTFPFSDFASFYKNKQADITLAFQVNNLEKLKRSGVIQFDDMQKVIGFEEKPAVPESSYICPALYIFRQQTCSLFQVYLDAGENPDAPGNFLNWLYKRNTVYAYKLTRPYYDIGTLDAYQKAIKSIAKNDIRLERQA